MNELLELSAVHFGYPGQPPVLKGVDLTLRAGERIALTGPNGTGKSTLLLLCVGLLKPTHGQIRAFGQLRQREADFREVRARIGLVFQDPDDQLFCPTVQEDIAFGPLNQGKTLAEALALVEQTLSQLNLLHLKERVTYQLSGGEKRLVSLACVLAMQPEILLLDEPTNALDEATCERLIEILNHLPQTLVIISHDARFLRRVTQSQWQLKDGYILPLPSPLSPVPAHRHDGALRTLSGIKMMGSGR
ncbi:energy-coupling factor ABC transporter ATP-binding protein [Thiorhodospira sibirica]|uniref:energy-coupling factor ABC transporter ATP-binding protein n=1 Tax=Thiorhodospira sibirica TaxID=154347 RepID=UPI00022C286C|nr:ABC transporter ATP-binding protein [Thiorhodospira sibirica]